MFRVKLICSFFFSFRWNSKCLNTILQHYSVPWEHYSGGWLAALGSFCGGAAVCLVYPWFRKSPTWLGSLGSYINALMFSDVAQSSIPCVIVCPPTPFSRPGIYWIAVDGAGLYLNQNFTRFFFLLAQNTSHGLEDNKSPCRLILMPFCWLIFISKARKSSTRGTLSDNFTITISITAIVFLHCNNESNIISNFGSHTLNWYIAVKLRGKTCWIVFWREQVPNLIKLYSKPNQTHIVLTHNLNCR